MAPPRELHDNGNDYERQRQAEEGFGQSECHTDMVYQRVERSERARVAARRRAGRAAPRGVT
jgi:hypothetical protein